MVASQLRLVLLGWVVAVGLLSVENLASMPPDLLGEAIKGGLAGGTTGTLVALALVALYRRIRLPRTPRQLWAAALAASLLGAIVWFAVDEALAAVLSPEPVPPEAMEVPTFLGIPVPYIAQQLLLYFFILAAFHGVAISQRDLARAASAERLAQAARLDALRYQLNPHFLFNALNSAIVMIDEAPARAQTMLRRLSGLLRDTLRESASTSLGEELGIVRRYLEIEQVRFEDKLEFHEDVSPAAHRCVVPPLLVHALVENAVKHGMRSSAMPLRIWLSAARDDHGLHIEVRNTGRLEPGQDGVGLVNVSRRLDALYPGAHAFRLDEDDGMVRASVHIAAPESAA